MILEAGVVLSSEQVPLYWHVPPGRRAGYQIRPKTPFGG
jgi:hypothetical protein